MFIRRAVLKDIPKIDELLHQVNDIHASIRPDLFIKGEKKYTDNELSGIIRSDLTPVFVCFADENADDLLGYCFSVYEAKSGHSQAPVRTLYLDDICADEGARGKGVGREIYSLSGITPNVTTFITSRSMSGRTTIPPNPSMRLWDCMFSNTEWKIL